MPPAGGFFVARRIPPRDRENPTQEGDMDHGEDLRHHPARRRAVARHLARRRREARDRRAARAPRCRRDRGRLPDRQPTATSSRSRRSPRRCAGPIITGLSRTGFKDVDRAWEAVRHAERPRIHIFIATSKIHMEKKLRMTPEQVKARGRGGGRPRQGLLRRRRVLARGRLPLRPRLHVRGVPDRGRQRRDHAEHPRHRRLRRCPRTTAS